VNCSRTLAFKSQSGHWLGPVTRLGLPGPAQPHGPGWAQPKKKKILLEKIISKKICDFLNFFFVI
jgi:hypothetical protein